MIKRLPTKQFNGLYSILWSQVTHNVPFYVRQKRYISFSKQSFFICLIQQHQYFGKVGFHANRCMFENKVKKGSINWFLSGIKSNESYGYALPIVICLTQQHQYFGKVGFHANRCMFENKVKRGSNNWFLSGIKSNESYGYALSIVICLTQQRQYFSNIDFHANRWMFENKVKRGSNNWFLSGIKSNDSYGYALSIVVTLEGTGKCNLWPFVTIFDGNLLLWDTSQSNCKINHTKDNGPRLDFVMWECISSVCCWPY